MREREDDEKLPPAVIDQEPCSITARYLPTIGVWIAGERRSKPYCWRLDATAMFPDEDHRPSRVEEGRLEVWVVLGIGKTSDAALAAARERKALQ